MSTGKGRWTNDEHERYVEGLKRFGPDFKKLSLFIQTRKATQIRYYHRRFQEKAKDVAAVASQAATSIAPSTSLAKKRGIEDDGAATEAKKKVKVATEEETASGSPPLTARPVRTDDTLAVPSPKLTPTLVPVRDSATEVEQKPAAIPLPEIDEIPPSMKSPIKLAPKSKKIDADDKVHEDGTNDPPKTSETKEIDIDVGGGNVLAPVAGGGCPLKFVNSLLQNEYVQCILGGVLGFLALQVVKMIIP